MAAPVDQAGDKISCEECGQLMQVPARDRGKAKPASDPGDEDERGAGASGIKRGSPPRLPELDEPLAWHSPERLLPILTRACYGGIWVIFVFNCIAALMPNMGLIVLCSIVAFFFTAVNLAMSLYTFSISATLWKGKKDGNAVAGFISSTLTTIFCTFMLMCNCGSGVVMIKGIDTLGQLGHRGGF